MARGGRGTGRTNSGDPGSTTSSYGGNHRMNKTERRSAGMQSSRRGGGAAGGASGSVSGNASNHWRNPNAVNVPPPNPRNPNTAVGVNNPPPIPAVVEYAPVETSGVIPVDMTRRPPPQVAIAPPTIEAAAHPTETPKPYEPVKAGLDPRSVVAVMDRVLPVTIEAVIEAWRHMELQAKAAAKCLTESPRVSSAKHVYTIAQLLKLKEASLGFMGESSFTGIVNAPSIHSRRRSQPGFSPTSQPRSTSSNDPLKSKEWRAPPPPPPPPPPVKRADVPRPQALRRHTKSLLNKMTVEKFQAIAELLITDILETCADESELQIVVDEVYKKAVSEPDFSEMYADLVVVLRAKSPEFPASSPEKKPLDFKRAIVVRCEVEFNNMQDPETEDLSVLSEEDAELARIKRKRQILGNMRFIGELYMRKVISTTALRTIVCVMIDTPSPEPHIIECLCELLTTIGYTLDQQCGDTTKTILSTLNSLRHKFETRINCKIQDLLDLAKNGWRQRLFKSKATTLNDVNSHVLESNVAGIQSDFPYKKYVHEIDDQYWKRKKEQRQKNRQQQQQQSQVAGDGENKP